MWRTSPNRFRAAVIGLLLVAGLAIGLIIKQRQSMAAHMPSALTTDQADYDLGKAVVGSAVTREIVLHNRSQIPLLIRKVVKSCACTETQLPAQRVPPMGSIRMEVKIKPSAEQETKNGSIVISYINAEGTPYPEQNLVLTFHATMMAAFDYFPKNVTIHPEQLQSAQEVQIVRVRRGLYSLDWDDVVAECNEPGITLHNVQLNTDTYDLHLQVDPARVRAGKHTALLTIHTCKAGVRVTPDLQVPVYVEGIDDVKIVPSSLYLGTLPLNSSVNRSFKVEVEWNPSVIVQAESDDASQVICVVTPDEASGQTQVACTVVAHQAGGNRVCVKIRIGGARQIEAVVPVIWMGK